MKKLAILLIFPLLFSFDTQREDAFQTGEWFKFRVHYGLINAGYATLEVQDGVTVTDHGIIDYLLVTSTDFWDGLPADVRDQLATIVDEVTAARNSESTSVNADNKQAILDAGGVIRTLDVAQRAEWVSTMKPVWEQFVGDVGQEDIDAAQAINAKH